MNLFSSFFHFNNLPLLSLKREVKEYVREVWAYLKDTYLSLDFSDYEYIQLGGNNTSLITVVGGLFLGILLASFCIVFQKRVVGRYIQRMLAAGAIGEENACTPASLGFGKSMLLRAQLRSRSGVLRKLVRYVGEPGRTEADLAPGKQPVYYDIIDLGTTAFYIPEELKYRAEIRYAKKGTSWPLAVLFAILMIVLLFVVLRALPTLLDFINSAIGGVIEGRE